MEDHTQTDLFAPETNHDEKELARLATIVASSDDAIVGKTLEGVVLSWNRAAENIYGYAAQEMVGRPISILVPPDRQAELDDIMARIRSGLHVKHLETVRIRKDGVPIDIFLTVSPIYDRKGNLIGASSIARDITERKEDERRRFAMHELLQLFVRATTKKDYLHETLRLTRDWCGCEAVGLEISDAETDICFDAHIGFSKDFLMVGRCFFPDVKQSALTKGSENASPMGAPGCFTPGGSFLCDDISGAGSVPEDTGLAAWIQWLAKAGYRSVAIIPVRHLGMIRGAVHMADRAKAKISRRLLDFMEAVTPVIGEAIYRFQLEDERSRAEKVLRAAKKDLSEAQRLARIGSWEWDIGSGRLAWSDEVYRIVGRDKDAFTPDYGAFLDLVHPDERRLFSHAVNRALYENEPYDVVHRVMRPNGEERVVRELGKVERDASGRPVLMRGAIQDITAYEQAREELEKLSLAVEQASDWVLITDHEGNIVYANKMVEQLSGYTKEELMGQNPRIIKSEKHDKQFYTELWSTISVGKPYRAVFINRRKNRELFYLDMTITPVRDRMGTISYFVSTAKDITQEKILQERLDYMAYYDLLTGLPNRTLFMDRLKQALSSLQHSGRLLAVCTLDIDRFKLVNDAYGPQRADEVLKQVGKRLSSALREGDTAARLGSDEFGLLLMDLARLEDVIPLINNVMRQVSAPITDSNIVLTSTIGIAAFPDDGSTPEALIRNSESALETARQEGRNLYRFYTPGLNLRAAEFLKVEQRLLRALKDNEFRLHFQPYYLVDTKEIAGMEALIRWERPGEGLVLPGKFIPVLEETGMIVQAGEWIIRTACEYIDKWSAEGIQVPQVSLNLSAVQFRQQDLVDQIERVLAYSVEGAKRLTFELTETTFVQDIEFTGKVLGRLKALGAHISIDDFGTGYSSMTYLKRLPVDNLKIDISFIKDIADDPDSASIVMAMISMGHALNKKIIAEGVETEAQWKILRLLRCDMMQGFYLSRALPAEEIEKLLPRS